MNRQRDDVKQRCQAGFVPSGVHHLNMPPEIMPAKKNGWPTGLRQRSGSGRFYQVFNDRTRSPKQKWVSLNTKSRKRAEIERGRLIAAYEARTFDPWQEKVDDVSLQDAFVGYMETKAGLAPNSILSKKQAIDLFLRSIPDKTRPAQVQVQDFKRFFDRSRLKSSSIKTRLAELGQFFKWCVDQGYATSNPAKLYKEDRARGMSRFESKREERELEQRGAIMPSAFRALIGHVSTQAAMASAPMQARHDLMRDLIVFGAATGLRRAELVHLCRRDVRLGPPVGNYPDTGILTVRCWLSPSGEHFNTKDGLDRRLRMPPVAARIAARHLATGATEDGYAPLFRSMRGRRLYPPSLTDWFTEYRKAARLPEATSFHSLRHTYASWLLMLGCDVLLIQRFMGHASLNMMQHYARLAERYIFGAAREVQREILMILCPDLSPATVEVLLPARTSYSETLREHGLRRRSVFPMVDVIFDGAAYEVEEAMSNPENRPVLPPDLHGYSDLIKTG